MILARGLKKKIAKICLALLIFISISNINSGLVSAATGNVYTCSISACYRNPSTGVIEDSGGESGYATGQGMVQSCIKETGIMEVTDEGAYYLTFRMSLVDFTSNHSFWVQNMGDAEWTAPSEIGVTGNGTDANGSTMDVCVKVPSESCLVRISMYVDAMGRTVIYYIYPSNYVSGNSTDMNSTMISTENTNNSNSGNNSNSNDNNTNSSATTNNTINNSDSSANNASNDTSSNTNNSGNSTVANTSDVKANEEVDNTTNSSTTTTNNKSQVTDESTSTIVDNKGDNSNNEDLENNIVSNTNSNANSTNTNTITSIDNKGLNLSTEKDIDKNIASPNVTTTLTTTNTATSLVFQITLAVIITGLIFILTIAWIIYFFRRNWIRWKGAEDDYE